MAVTRGPVWLNRTGQLADTPPFDLNHGKKEGILPKLALAHGNGCHLTKMA